MKWMLGLRHAKPNAMLPEDGDEEPPYSGPYCVIRPEAGLSYSVAIEPPLPCGAGSPRTYGSKHEAFGAARALWTQFSLPLQDLTDGKWGPRNSEEKSN